MIKVQDAEILATDNRRLQLALCKKIGQRDGGFISANGQKDKGAEFIILLPLN